MSSATKTPPAPGHLRRVIEMRQKKLLDRFMESADQEQLLRAASAETDFDLAVEILNAPAVVGFMRQKDPLTNATLRGLKMMRDLLAAEGGPLTAGQVAERLSISTQAVNQRRVKDQLVALDVGRNGFMYPAWQFVAGGGALPGLDKVLKELAKNECASWDLLTFFLNKSVALNGHSPLAEEMDCAALLCAGLCAEFGGHGRTMIHNIV